MIRGLYPKIFLWFCFATALMVGSVLAFTVATHSHSLGPSWMTGVLNLYARTAVEVYAHGGKADLEQYLDEVERTSRMRATLLDPQSRDILGRGVPAGAMDILAKARAAGESRFHTGLHWTGASIVPGADGNYILVAELVPLQGFWNWPGQALAVLRVGVALLCGGLLCLMLARHIAAPVRSLQTVARRIADGDLSVRAFPAIATRNDELSDLAKDFDRMADHVQMLIEKQQEILGDISHELRSPLTRLRVSVELVRRGETDAFEQMQSDLDSLDALIGQILTLTRLQTLSDPRMGTEVNLRSILEGVIEDARFEGKESCKTIVLGCAADCRLTGDPGLLRSCIENVVRNAVRYTKPQTEVTIGMDLVRQGERQMARILVADCGDGVPPEALARLFEPFYRVSASQSQQTGGTGLGLSIAHRIVLLYGGKILARNRDEGGLEMEICFPVRDLHSAQS